MGLGILVLGVGVAVTVLYRLPRSTQVTQLGGKPDPDSCDTNVHMFENPIKVDQAVTFAASATAPVSPVSPKLRLGVPPAPAGGCGREALVSLIQFVRPVMDRANVGSFRSQPVSRRRSEDSDELAPNLP